MSSSTPNTTANSGQILTDERIMEIGLRVNAIESSNNGGYFLPVTFARAIEADLRAALAAPATKLSVWYGAIPESNGKSNFTAILHSGDISKGITLDRSEYPDRVRYEADCARHVIGELTERPFILDYDADKRSDYVAPAIQTDHDEAVTLLSAVFDTWENGDDCHEEGDPSGTYLGKCFPLDDDVFKRCCDLLNRLNPPRNVAPAIPTVDRNAVSVAQDLFDGDDAALCESIHTLLAMDQVGTLVPHGVGGHARTLLATAALRLADGVAQPAAQGAVPVGLPDMSDDMLTPDEMRRHVRARRQERCDHDYLTSTGFGGALCIKCDMVEPKPIAKQSTDKTAEKSDTQPVKP